MKLYDTLTRSLRELHASDGKNFRFYVCGPTVYGPAHIGNFRTFVLNDVLRRCLELANLNPFYVRNITDVDDKTIQRSQEEELSLKAFTEKWTEKFHQDCHTLNLLNPDVEPKATEHLKEQIDLINILIEKGHAYVGDDGSVYYKVKSFSDYGKLAHFKIDELESQSTNSAGKINLSDEYERESIADFALWKAQKPEDGNNVWEGPTDPRTGEKLLGRPGWHIECSAMSMRYLGESLDLHGGGEDLCFPHHENEIAQSEAATGKPFTHHWMHCVHLLVEGKKMSKSLGNFFTLNDLIEKGYSPESIRYNLISAHYRQHLNLTMKGLDAAKSALTKLEKAIRPCLAPCALSEESFHQQALMSFQAIKEQGSSFATAAQMLEEDMNTPASLGNIFTALKTLSPDQPSLKTDLQALNSLLYALGIKLFVTPAKENVAIPSTIQDIGEKRWQAKQAKDWATADQLRDELAQQGWKSLDRKDGYDLEPISK